MRSQTSDSRCSGLLRNARVSALSGLSFLALAALSPSCAPARYRSVPANRPLTRAELSSRLVSLAPAEPSESFARQAHELRVALAPALAAEGFTVVAHPPYAGDLEVRLRVLQDAAGLHATATLRSDGFFVDEADVAIAADGRAQEVAAALARTLAASFGMADFVRHSGVPAQTLFSN